MTRTLNARNVSSLIAVAALALGGLGACTWFLGSGPHVPGAYQGTTPVTVVNAWNRELCVFAIYQGAPDSDNWLGTKSKQQNIAPGGRLTFNIKPGVYHVVGGFCAEGQAVAAGGTYGAETTELQGPSLIALGPNPVEPAPGQKMLAFTQLHGMDGGGGAAPAEASASSPDESSSSSDESSSSDQGTSAEPSGGANDSNPNCKPSGATCDQSYQCCSGACVTHSPDDYCR